MTAHTTVTEIAQPVQILKGAAKGLSLHLRLRREVGGLLDAMRLSPCMTSPSEVYRERELHRLCQEILEERQL